MKFGRRSPNQSSSPNGSDARKAAPAEGTSKGLRLGKIEKPAPQIPNAPRKPPSAVPPATPAQERTPQTRARVGVPAGVVGTTFARRPSVPKGGPARYLQTLREKVGGRYMLAATVGLALLLALALMPSTVEPCPG